MLVVCPRRPLSTQRQLCSLGLSNGDILLGGLNLLPVDLRPHLHRFIESISDLEVFCAQGKFRRKLLINPFLNNHPAGGGATLPGCAECTPQYSFERQVNIGIVKDNDGIFSAHLQRTGLKAAGCFLSNHPPYLARTGKRDGANIRVLNQWPARLRAKTGNDVHHALRQSGIG